jgi:hypothetical protein
MEFWLLRSPFSTNFSFSRWNSGYQGAFHKNFSSSRWNFGNHEALFSQTFFHDGILAIKEPFTQTFLLHDRILAIMKPFFHELFFFTMEFTKCTNLGKTRFIYITKSIYTGPASLKTLALDLEPPLQGKEYGPSYSDEIAKRKDNVFVPEISYRFVIRVLFF